MRRSSFLPELPTLDEAGLKGFDMTTWWGLMAPAKTPQQMVDRISQEALRAIDYRPTTIVIAHRLSTVANVNRVVVLDRGVIVQSGTHDELLQNSSFYRQLVMTQLVAQ